MFEFIDAAFEFDFIDLDAIIAALATEPTPESGGDAAAAQDPAAPLSAAPADSPPAGPAASEALSDQPVAEAGGADDIVLVGFSLRDPWVAFEL